MEDGEETPCFTVVRTLDDGRVIERPLRDLLLPPFLGHTLSEDDARLAIRSLRRITPEEWRRHRSMTPEQRIEHAFELMANSPPDPAREARRKRRAAWK